MFEIAGGIILAFVGFPLAILVAFWLFQKLAPVVASIFTLMLLGGGLWAVYSLVRWWFENPDAFWSFAGITGAIIAFFTVAYFGGAALDRRDQARNAKATKSEPELR